MICTLAGPMAQARAVEERIVADEPPPGDPGPEGERRWQRDVELIEAHAQEQGETRSLSDDDAVRHVLGAASASEREANCWWGWLWERTNVLVSTREFWKPCLALAAELEQRETIDGPGCVEILEVALARSLPQPRGC